MGLSTRLRVGQFWVRKPGRAKDCSLAQRAQAGSGLNPAFYSMGKGKGKVLPRTGHEGPEGE